MQGEGDLGGLEGWRGGIVPPEMGVNGRVLGQIWHFWAKNERDEQGEKVCIQKKFMEENGTLDLAKWAALRYRQPA